MSLIATPDRELIFYGPFNTPSVTSVELLNNSDDRLAYKFRTNIIGRYIVKPNNGFIGPHEKVTVQITLNPSKDGEAQGQKTHLFRIQWTALKDDEIEDSAFFTNKELETRFSHISLICLFHERPTLTQTESIQDELEKAKQIIQELENERKMLMTRGSSNVFGFELNEIGLLIFFFITLFIGVGLGRVFFTSQS